MWIWALLVRVHSVGIGVDTHIGGEYSYEIGVVDWDWIQPNLLYCEAIEERLFSNRLVSF